jgi:hypothetical protein
MALLGKLKALGDKLENVATSVAKEVVSGVQTGVTTVGTGVQLVGTGVITVARDIKDSVLDDELDKIRSVHAFQKTQAALQDARRKPLSERELDAADARATAVLEQLPPGYYERDYDPVRDELQRLGEGDGQEEVDQITERLGAFMEVRVCALEIADRHKHVVEMQGGTRQLLPLWRRHVIRYLHAGKSSRASAGRRQTLQVARHCAVLVSRRAATVSRVHHTRARAGCQRQAVTAGDEEA